MHLCFVTYIFRVQSQYLLFCDAPAIFGRSPQDNKDRKDEMKQYPLFLKSLYNLYTIGYSLNTLFMSSIV